MRKQRDVIAQIGGIGYVHYIDNDEHRSLYAAEWRSWDKL